MIKLLTNKELEFYREDDARYHLHRLKDQEGEGVISFEISTEILETWNKNISTIVWKTGKELTIELFEALLKALEVNVTVTPHPEKYRYIIEIRKEELNG